MRVSVEISIEEERAKKRRTLVIISTLLIHVLIGCGIYVVKWTTEIPQYPEYILLEFNSGGGTPGGGSGSPAPGPPTAAETPAIPSPAVSNPNPPVYTQPNSQVHTPVSTPNTQPTASTPQERRPNPNALFQGGNGETGTGQGGAGDGIGAGFGDGVGNGDGGSGGGQGGGHGPGIGPYSGPGLNMSGRTQVYWPKPDNPGLERGKLVFSIWVDQNGKVSRVKVEQQLSTTNDPKLISECEKVLLGKQIVKADTKAPLEQKGLYEFVFKVE